MRRVISLAILIIVNFVLQSTLLGFHSAFSITPNLLLILTMSFGLMRGRKEGMLVGFFSGLLIDIFFDSLIGPFMLLYMVIGYVNGFYHRNYVIEDVSLPLLVIIIDDFCYNFAVYVFYFLLNNKLNFKEYLLSTIFPEMITTALLTVVLYKLYVIINRHLKKKEA